ncbi:MAG: hypothetical protein JNL98_19730 [Bryobacterales bacterium]|nr:hypothetical protein [Bryobacterales bacterium]
MIHGGSDADGTDLGAGPLLGLLAAPGVLQCLLMVEKYSSLLDWIRGRQGVDLLVISAPEKYMFAAISIAVTGIVVALKWDRILPDAQDYINLAPLPVRPRTIFAANVTAMGIAACVIALTVNSMPLLLFPAMVSSAAADGSIGTLEFFAVHALCMLMASVFAFAAALAVLGAASAILPARVCAAWAGPIRAVLLIACTALLLGALQAGPMMRMIVATPGSYVRWLPPMWFTGLYQTMQDRGPVAIARLAPLAWQSLLAAILMLTVCYGVSYARRFRATVEISAPASSRPLATVLLWLLDHLLLARNSFDRAVCHFAFRGLLRLDEHRLALLVPFGLGWLLAAQYIAVASGRTGATAASIHSAMLAAPLIPAYLVVLGVRIGIDMPASVPANWMFRHILHADSCPVRSALRHLAMTIATLFAVLPSLAAWAYAIGPGTALLQASCMLVLILLHAEVVFRKHSRLPFTCALPPFREKLPATIGVHFLGMLLFVSGGGALQTWIGRSPIHLFYVVAGAAALLWWNESELRRDREDGDPNTVLSFEHHDDGALATISLTDAAPASRAPWRPGNQQ